MAALILGPILFGVAVVLALVHIRVRRQTAEQAVARVRRALYGKRNAQGRVEVQRWGMRPLSDHMIKDVAHAEGCAFHDTRVLPGSGLTALEFTSPTPRKLSLDD